MKLLTLLLFPLSVWGQPCENEHLMCWDLYDLELYGSQCFVGYGSIQKSVTIKDWGHLTFKSTTASLNYAPDLKVNNPIYTTGYAVSFWGETEITDTIFVGQGTRVTIAYPSGNGVILMDEGSRLFIGENPQEYLPGNKLDGIKIVAKQQTIRQNKTILYYIPSLGLYATKTWQN